MKDKNLPIKKKGIMLLYLIGSEWLVPQCIISNNDILAHYEIVLIVNIWKESNPCGKFAYILCTLVCSFLHL